MRLGLISDVHCHVDAFNRTVADLARDVDEILMLGDAE
jgi:predicted phosphodiesterase